MPNRTSFDNRAEDHPSTLFAWLWLNLGPLVPIALAAAAIFDDAHAAKWAAFAAAVAGLSGGGTLPRMLGNSKKTTDADAKEFNEWKKRKETPPTKPD